MVGTGSTLIAAMRAGRHSYGIELNPVYADIARQAVEEERVFLGENTTGVTAEVITGDAAHLAELVKTCHIPPIDYVITSPPYWNMLHARGAKTQGQRRSSPDLDVVYSENPDDLGNIAEYEEFLSRLSNIYTGIQPFLKPKAYLTIIVKNVKKGGKIYPLAWDLAHLLSKTYRLKDEKIWCQDDIRLSPYGLGKAWVSNTFHHYCLQFRNE